MLKPSNQSLETSPHAVAARGFGQTFGLHPPIAFLTLILNAMLFGGEIVTMGAILPISIASGIVLAFITFLAQRKYFGDDDQGALIKALILGLVTAVPAPLPALLYVPSGIVGLVHNLRRQRHD